MWGNGLTRRNFAKLLGGALVSRTAHALPGMRSNEKPFACVASRNKEDAGLHLFSIEAEHWKEVDFLSVREPSALVALPGGRGVVVANSVSDFQHRPSGYVESYLLDRKLGRLSLISRRGLSLAATAPQSLAISNCGNHLAVLAAAGSILNILPLDDSGIIGHPSLVRKRIAPRSSRGRLLRFSRVAFDSGRQPLWLDERELPSAPPKEIATSIPHASAFIML